MTTTCTATLVAQRRRSNGKRRLIHTKSGAVAKQEYQMNDPTPRLRSSSPVLAGGRPMRGNALPPGGTPGGPAVNCEATSVTTISAADAATTVQKSLSDFTGAIRYSSFAIRLTATLRTMHVRYARGILADDRAAIRL
jgi:hypothetical protein